MGKYWGCIAVAILFLIGCSDEKKKLPTVGDEETGELVQIIENSVMDFYDGPRRLFRLESKRMRKELTPQGKTVAHPVRLTIYDSLGNTGTTVVADSGSTDNRQDRFVVWGRAVINTQEGHVVKSEKLWWKRDSHRVLSDTFVQITTPTGDVMRGKGLDAAENFSTWSMRQVSGEFPNFRARLEGEDDFLGGGPKK